MKQWLPDVKTNATVMRIQLMDQLPYATYSLRDLVIYRQWAEKPGCAMEQHTVADPAVLAGDGCGAPLPYHCCNR